MFDEVTAIRALLVGFLLVLGYPILRRRFYLRPLSGEILFRTGVGGVRIVRERGGCWFFSHLHTLTIVHLSTFRLNVTQRVITRDQRDATVDVAFYFRILDVDQSIQSAARSFTQNAANPGPSVNPIRHLTPYSVSRVIEHQLSAAIRIGVYAFTLEELLLRPNQWLEVGLQFLAYDLSHYGLVIENSNTERIMAETSL
jgi:uncharacterized membrane protein YqiK